MRRNSGYTLVEALVVLAVGAIISMLAVLFSSSWLKQESMRSATYEIYTHLGLARVEATRRSGRCTFRIDTSGGTIEVVDPHDTSSSTDDETIATVKLPRTVRFGSPDGGPPVTLDLVSGTTYETTFAEDGTVATGAGEIVLQNGGRFARISLYRGGAVRVDRWDGSGWVQGY